MNGILAPLLPFVLAGIALDIFWQTPVASIWMISRVFVTAIMWKSGHWHGKWAILWLAIFAMASGFMLILSANSLLVLIIGLTIFGAGVGVTYYAALYYAMAVGRAEVDAAGKHEAFIGGGYMLGPIVGLASLQTTSTSFTPIIYVVSSIMVIAAVTLALFWRKAR